MRTKIVEVIASVLILVSSVFASEWLIHTYFFTPSPSAPTPARPQNALTQVALRNVDLSESPRTLILALQTSCGFCNRSAPFYRRLVENAGKNVRILAVIPGRIDANRAHMEKLGLQNLEVVAGSLDSISVDATPTLLLVNKRGEVTDSWVGMLPADKEAEVISKIMTEG
jgi:hypothetical protein